VHGQIIGVERVEKLYASASHDQMHVQRYLSANCFGNHVSRGGINIPTSVTLTLSMLVSLGGCDTQVKEHVSANLHVGNSWEPLIDLSTQQVPFIGTPGSLNGLRAVDEVIAA
jgi:4-carboxymuconolactone decarboxylase